MADTPDLPRSPWPAEDAGPERTGAPLSAPGLGLGSSSRLVANWREVPLATMAVIGGKGELYLLRTSIGPDAICFVERLDPVSLEAIVTSPELPGGPMWPGGLAVHPDGSLHVVFGRHAHRLSPGLELLASTALPRARPYNSFVTLPGGELATKDFTGPFNGRDLDDDRPSELLILDPVGLDTLASLELPEASVARLSAVGNEVVVVGVDSLLSYRYVEGHLAESRSPVRYRLHEGQGHGWDAVLEGDVAWLLDNGEGTDAYDGSFRGKGIATEPLRLHRIDRSSGEHRSAEVCGLPGGIIANPPVVDRSRRIAVGYDSGNGVVAAFDADDLKPIWRRDDHFHAAHSIHYEDTGELVLFDYDADAMSEELVVIDIESGSELARCATGSPVSSVLFPCAGLDRTLYSVSFTTISRIEAVG